MSQMINVPHEPHELHELQEQHEPQTPHEVHARVGLRDPPATDACRGGEHAIVILQCWSCQWYRSVTALCRCVALVSAIVGLCLLTIL